MRPVRLLIAVFAAGWICQPGPGTAQDVVVEQLNRVLETAESAISADFARTMPLPSASAGVSYSFDAVSGNFQRDPATFGQIYLDRADPLGKGRFNISFTYQFAKLDELEGRNAGDLEEPLPIPFEGLFAAMQIPAFEIDAEVHSFLMALSYGFTDDLEASLALPLIYSDVRIRMELVAAAFDDNAELFVFDDAFGDESDVVGFGDVLLRLKYRLLEHRQVHAASGVLLRLPSGNDTALHGTGFVEVAPSLLLSSRVFEPARWARLQGHFNATAGLNAEHLDASEARWGVGLDWGVTEEITAALAFLGRHPFARIGPAGSFLFPRCNTDVISCAGDATVRDASAPLLGLSGDRADTYTLSIGGRGGLWRDTLFAFANLAVPLNDGFLRTYPIPLVGLEATF
ncbi:MAG TPA: hypothetical protein VEB21_19820 [Terriglobales bacterium]|nr:hypothetical protein [Terriglobales bacterium]